MRPTLFFTVLIVLTSISTAQGPIIFYYPSEKKVNEKVDCTIERQSDGSNRFRYKVSNLAGAEQRIWVIRIPMSSQVREMSAPEDWEVNVTAGVQGITRIKWVAADTVFFIQPGSTVEGFAFTSDALPGIRPYYVKGWIDLPKVDIEPDSIVGGGDIFETSKSGVTVAPIDPPAQFLPLIFLDTLISYKHQAFDLGWITNEGIVTSLDQKLENARKQLERGNNNSAKNILRAFLNEVEAQKDIHLSSEAYALLKFNAEYLISKL